MSRTYRADAEIRSKRRADHQRRQMRANSRIVWTAETGWTDNGPRAITTIDERGRLVIVKADR